MPGYMSGTKRAASTPSISNNTKIFGDMAGNVSTRGKPWYLARYIRSRTLERDPTWGMAPADAKNYMFNRGTLSKNPLGSGGVGRTQPNYHRSGLRW
jgi:hypothetical protein